MFAGVVAETYIQGRTGRREISWERGWGWGKGADKGPNKGVVFCVLGWWLKLIFQGRQGEGAYLGRDGGAGGRELTRTPTTTKNKTHLPIHAAISDR